MDPISAGANLLGSVFNVVSQERTNENNASMLDKQNQFNRDMQKDQQQYNSSMWDKQNAYNTPKSQLDRYREAGLNPNLLYGQPNPGNAAQAATSGQASSSNAIARRAPQLDPISVANVQLIKAQKEKTETESELLKQELPYKSDSLRLDIEGKNLSNIAQDIRNRIDSETSQEQINTIKEQFKVTERQAEMLYQQALVLSLEYDLREQGLKMKQIDNIMYQAFKDEELKEIQYRNKIAGIDADNYEKLFGDDDDKGKSNTAKQVVTIIQMLLGGYKSIK